MGRYAIILIITLVVLLSFYVIHVNNQKTQSVNENIDDFSYKQAVNIANSATQMVARNLMRPDVSGWPDFTLEYDIGSVIEHIDPLYWGDNWLEWNNLNGVFQVASLYKLEGDRPDLRDLMLIVASKEDYRDKSQQTKVFLKQNETLIPFWDFAVYAREFINIQGSNSYIDSYNSDIAPYDPNMTPNNSNASIGLYEDYQSDNYPFYCRGEVYGDDPEYGVDKQIYPVEGPTEGVIMNNFTVTSLTSDPDDTYIVTQNNLVINQTVTIPSGNHVIIHFLGNVRINGVFHIEDGASLTIYISESLYTSGDSFINDSEIPSNLQIFGTESCTHIKMTGMTELHGAIYAPNADVEIVGDATIYGAILCNSLYINGNGIIHYDEALGQDSNLTHDSIFKFYIASWE
ncbi:MAG: hypothetical protein K0B81_09140 [Candidatus Cloacimonetes bacterium]|nr:hypothetical protein [Candidatus Cloacimonadota bacterium]